MPRISVIVPVYNVEAYLSRCVDSVLEQSFPDWELLLVDDGSPDGSGTICDAYAARDPRVAVLHKENGGLSSARNAGLDAAKGEWVTFLDSDDYLHPRMLEALYGAVTKYGVSVCVGGFARTNGDPLPEPEQGWEAQLWEPAAFYRKQIVNATIACAKLYRRSCFENLRFPEGKLHEDEFVTYRILMADDKIAVLPAAGYAYYWNEASITNVGWSPRRMDALEALEQQVEFFILRDLQELYVMRIRDYLKTAIGFLQSIDALPQPSVYASEYRFLKKNGKRFLRKYGRRGKLELERDGWIIGCFYPWVIRLHGLVNGVFSKLHR